MYTVRLKKFKLNLCVAYSNVSRISLGQMNVLKKIW